MDEVAYDFPQTEPPGRKTYCTKPDGSYVGLGLQVWSACVVRLGIATFKLKKGDWLLSVGGRTDVIPQREFDQLYRAQ